MYIYYLARRRQKQTTQWNEYLFYNFSQVSSPQWDSVRGDLTSGGGVNGGGVWPQDATAALIQWVPRLTGAPLPPVLREALARNGQIGRGRMREMDPESEVAPLVQWGDMVVFDFLAGNHDRITYLQVIQ